MGIGGISVGSLLIVLVIVLLLFGTKKLRNIGGDLGGAIKGFRSAMKDGGKDDAEADGEPDGDEKTTAAHLEDQSDSLDSAGKKTDKASKSHDRSSS